MPGCDPIAQVAAFFVGEKRVTKDREGIDYTVAQPIAYAAALLNPIEVVLFQLAFGRVGGRIWEPGSVQKPIQ